MEGVTKKRDFIGIGPSGGKDHGLCLHRSCLQSSRYKPGRDNEAIRVDISLRARNLTIFNEIVIAADGENTRWHRCQVDNDKYYQLGNKL